MTVIYGLYDKSGDLRYIGKANNHVARLKSHMKDARHRNTPLYAWIRKHGTPEIRVIVECGPGWELAERDEIAKARATGARLLNLADGGDEPFCPAHVRAENGRKVAEMRSATPKQRRFWYLKQQLAVLLKRGQVSKATVAKIKARPDVFGGILANAKAL